MEPSRWDRAYRHVRARVEERYGLHFTSYDYRKLRNASISGSSRFVRRLSNGREERLVTYRDTRFRVVYDFEYDLLVTVLPP